MAHSIEIISFHELTEKEQRAVSRYFESEFPGLFETGEFQAFNFTRSDEGIVDWVDLYLIDVEAHQ